ncbi:D-alanyl-D-alanine carboxypeptidase [Alphaproteobacteria bacterium]|nr:D-alanyl-D-alanine carboxypeptidase [Alphaproteobacteria bacterium]
MLARRVRARYNRGIMKKNPLLSLAFLAFLSAAPVPARAVEEPQITAPHALLVDHDTGAVLFSRRATEFMVPASMSKLMTAYLLFEALKAGHISMDSEFTVSENAWKKGGSGTDGSTMFLKIGQKVSVSDLLRGIIVQSGNDACIVIAENMAGTEIKFAGAMNRKAGEIGLKNSVFRNSTGLPEVGHVMTARDLVILTRAIIRDFPEYYPIFAEKDFVFNGITQANRNPLLYADFPDGAVGDGVKTGHTERSGYGLVGAARTRDGGRRLLMVINGLKSKALRGAESAHLMAWGLNNFNNYNLFNAGEPIDRIKVHMGAADTVAVSSPAEVVATLPRDSYHQAVVKIKFFEPIAAPVAAGTKVGTAAVFHPEIEGRQEYDLVVSEDVPKAGFFKRVYLSARYWAAKFLAR